LLLIDSQEMKVDTDISDQEMVNKLNGMKNELKSTITLLQSQICETINLLDSCIKKYEDSAVSTNNKQEAASSLQKKYNNLKQQIMKNHADFLKICND